MALFVPNFMCFPCRFFVDYVNSLVLPCSTSSTGVDMASSNPTTTIRFSPDERKVVERFKKKKGFTTFSEALRQMIRRVAELEGWIK
jgi:hypothetical protein